MPKHLGETVSEESKKAAPCDARSGPRIFRIISDRRDPHATVSTLKRFVVESGKPGAVPGDVAADGVKLALEIVDAPAVEGERRDVVLPVELGDLVRDCLRIGRRSDRRNATEFGPGVVGSVILLAALLQVTRKPTVRFHMEHAIAILPDDHQGGEITSGAEVKPGIDAGP